MSLYRSTTLGETFVHSLREMVQDGDLEEVDAHRCVQIFDEVMRDSFAETPSKNKTINVQGHLQTYRNYEGLWTFIVKDARITMPSNKSNEVLYLDVPTAEIKAAERVKRNAN